jgi:hypothetical protein
VSAPEELVLLGSAADETRLLVHPLHGFSMPIPGHPALATPATPGPPAYHALVKMTDLPVELGVRIDALATSTDPQALAMSLTQAYAMSRAQEVRRVAPLRGRLLGHGFQGGANTIYVVRDAGPASQMEHVEVHTRQDGETTWAVYVTTRWVSSEVDVVRWAHLRTALGGQAYWDPASPRTNAPRLWPASSVFAEPDARLQLLPAAQGDAEKMSAELGPLGDDDANGLVDLLINTASGDDPPTGEVSEALIGAYCRRLVGRAPTTRAGETLLRNTPAIKTFHDLRAWCWQAIWALGHRPDQTDRSQLN